MPDPPLLPGQCVDALRVPVGLAQSKAAPQAMVAYGRPNENANQLQTTCDNLRSIAAARRAGRGRRPAPSAFVGCISGLGSGVATLAYPSLVTRLRRPARHECFSNTPPAPRPSISTAPPTIQAVSPILLRAGDPVLLSGRDIDVVRLKAAPLKTLKRAALVSRGSCLFSRTLPVDAGRPAQASGLVLDVNECEASLRSPSAGAVCLTTG